MDIYFFFQRKKIIRVKEGHKVMTKETTEKTEESFMFMCLKTAARHMERELQNSKEKQINSLLYLQTSTLLYQTVERSSRQKINQQYHQPTGSRISRLSNTPRVHVRFPGTCSSHQNRPYSELQKNKKGTLINLRQWKSHIVGSQITLKFFKNENEKITEKIS